MDTTLHRYSLITSQFTQFTHWCSLVFAFSQSGDFLILHQMPQTEAERQYQREYYKKNRAVIIARQMEYHREHREKYLAYAREYNKAYFKKHYVPKQKRAKEPLPAKEPKPAKPPKPVKERKPRKRKEVPLYVPVEPVYPTRIERGNFVLDFFN